jgi:hypothetical protein
LQTVLNNIGTIYHNYADKAYEKGNINQSKELYLKAKEYFIQSSELQKSNSDLLGLATTINNIGLIEQS